MKLMTRKNVCLFMVMVLFAAFGQHASHGQQSDTKLQKTNESFSKESSSTVPEEQTIRLQQRKERALYLLEAMAEGNLDDKVALAHMQSEVAALLCACGEQDKATEIFKKSLTEITANLLEKSKQKSSDLKEQYQVAAQVREGFELALRIGEAGSHCNPAFRKWAANAIENLGVSEKEKSQNIDTEPPVIPDVNWGTQPSIKRQLRAAILWRLAYQKMDEEKIEEAVSLLNQSLKICVELPAINALSRLKQKGSQDIPLSLYLQAAYRVKTSPSGTELEALHWGLRSMLGSGSGQGLTINASDALKSSVMEAYLDAISALLHDRNAAVASQSSGVAGLIKEALPWYAQLRPTAKIEVEQWAAKTLQGLPPSKRADVEERPVLESAENFVTRIQDIAAKTVNANERDQAYAAIASHYINYVKFDLAAEAIGRIADLTLKQELSDAAISRKLSFDLRKDLDLYAAKEEIEKIASLPMRVRSYLQLAKAAAKKAPPLRNDALDEAARLCAKIGTTTTVQGHLLLAVAKEFAEFDSTRAFDILRDAVHIINKTTEPTVKRWGKPSISSTVGTSGKFPRTLYESPSLYLKPYDFSIFKQLALVDFDSALYTASNINDKAVRASAEYEVCASILMQGKPPLKSGSKEIPPPE